MSRKGWDSLSGSYRERLERGGVDRAAYGRGESLSSARGHAGTPERPLTSFENPPERYRAYAELRKEILALNKEIYGHKETFNSRPENMAGKSRAHLEKVREGLQLMADNNWSLTELREEYPEYDTDEFDWLGYYH